MNKLCNLSQQKALLTTVIFSLFFLIILQGMYSIAQTHKESGTVEKHVARAPETFLVLKGNSKQASSEISKLQRRISEIERKQEDLQNKNMEMTENIAELRDLIKAFALKSEHQERKLNIEKVKRTAGGRPATRDAMVSVKQLSIVWRQIDNILDKLDEMTNKLSQ
jgi:septal ring factor EnvC (AmiA/AmiB activator)